MVEFPYDIFKEDPVVFSQITTQEVRNPYVTRHRYVTNLGFEVSLQAEEAKKVETNEEVSYMAWSLTEITGQQWYAGRSSEEVTNEGQSF